MSVAVKLLDSAVYEVQSFQESLVPGTKGPLFPHRHWLLAGPVLFCCLGLAEANFITDAPTTTGWLHEESSGFKPFSVLLLSVLGFSLLMLVVQGLKLIRAPWLNQRALLLCGGLFLLIGWDLITTKTRWLPLPFFPGPNGVFSALIEDRRLLLRSTVDSLQLLLAGYALGVSLGIASGILIGWFHQVRYWGIPILKFIGPIPATALVPFAMMISNEAFMCGAGLIAFAVWFPVTMLTTSGILNVRIAYLDVARTFGASPLFLIMRVALPSALPNIFFGLFMGLGVSFLTLITAETVGVKSGLGWYLQWKKGYAEYAHVYAALIIMSLFFSSIITLLFYVRDRILGWQKGVLRW